MDVRPDGSATDVSKEQPRKAPWPMDVRPAGSVIEASELQPEPKWLKALTPMDVRLDGSVMETSEPQEPKALSGTDVSPEG